MLNMCCANGIELALTNHPFGVTVHNSSEPTLYTYMFVEEFFFSFDDNAVIFVVSFSSLSFDSFVI